MLRRTSFAASADVFRRFGGRLSPLRRTLPTHVREVPVKRYELALAVGLLALGGCASTTKNQCLVGDWQTLGYRDGLNGTQSTALLRHQNSCMKHGVTPDREAYLTGWREGVVQYCQPDNGFDVGNSGAGYGNVCPEHLQQQFRAAYSDGRQLYLARVELNNLRHGIEQRETRLRDVKSEIAGITAELLSPEATTADRAALLLTAKDLAEEKGRLESEIEDLKLELAMKSVTAL
jgi:hypothetical protein